MKYFFTLVAIFLVGCTLQPTKVYETVSTDTVEPRTEDPSANPLTLGPQVVVVDAREKFEFSLFRLPGSVHLRWQDFAQTRSPLPGLLKDDLESEARRLARLGIAPDAKIIVVGNGLKGKGEEGRVAWTLAYLGFRNVEFVDLNYFKGPKKSLEEPKRTAVGSWQPDLQLQLLATYADVLKATSDGQTVILDVRSEPEVAKGKIAGSRNLEWKKFLNPLGRPSAQVLPTLVQMGLRPDSRIIVVSQQGVRSAAVTLALHKLGYSRARNFAGGLMEWQARSKTRPKP